MTDAGIKLIPIEKTNAPINPDTVFETSLDLWDSVKGELIILI